MSEKKKLTTRAGAPVSDNQNVATAGKRGPMLLQDVWFLEKLAHFDREVIPERRMHAKGSGAFGTFTVTHDITRYTKAKIFSEVGKKTELSLASRPWPASAARPMQNATSAALRSSSTPRRATGTWSATTPRSSSCAIRSSSPISTTRSSATPHQHAQRPEQLGLLDSLPEALHQVTIVMSDRGIPATYRHMHGFGSHTFSLINAKNERHWVKFHLRSQQGIKNLSDEEAEAIVGKDRESHQRDLLESIEIAAISRNGPCSSRSCRSRRRPPTATIPSTSPRSGPKKDYPLIEVGVLELNRNPENYFAEVEQSAFNPATSFPASASPRQDAAGPPVLLR